MQGQWETSKALGRMPEEMQLFTVSVKTAGVEMGSSFQLDIRTKHSSYGSYYLLNKKDAEIMSQTCALSTEQQWHRYQLCVL